MMDLIDEFGGQDDGLAVLIVEPSIATTDTKDRMALV